MLNYAKLADHPYTRRDIIRAKALRKEAPLVERLLWNTLQASANSVGLRFRRQRPIHPYIVDFACLKARLLIEIDGMSHDERSEYDKRRETYLRSLNYEIMRFTNDEVRQNLEGVVSTMINCALERIEMLYTPLP